MKMIRSIPAMPVREIAKAADFYRDRLAFAIAHQEPSFAILTRDQIEIHLWAAADDQWKARPSLVSAPVVSGAESFLAGTASCRIEVRDIDALFSEYHASGVLYAPHTKVESTPWGTREFPALDLERNLLTFFEGA